MTSSKDKLILSLIVLLLGLPLLFYFNPVCKQRTRFASVMSSDCMAYFDSCRHCSTYHVDSLLILKSVGNFVLMNHSFFPNCLDKSKPFLDRIAVDKIAYSPDKLKIQAFVYVECMTEHIDSVLLPNRIDPYFFSSTCEGFRDSTNQPWKIYELDECFSGFGATNLNDAKKFHESIFLDLNELSKLTICTWNPISSQMLTESILSLPCDSSYWSESPIWRLGTRAPNRFTFETCKNSTWDKPNIRQVPMLQVPDSIVEYYRNVQY